jgi:uncharacterized membrane protein
MSALVVGAIAFVCVFGATLVGMVLSKGLPDHHLSADSKDVIKVAMATIATLAALVLGLLVSSAKNSFDSKETEFRDSTVQVILLDRTLAAYGAETKETRDLLRQLVVLRLKQVWPEAGADTVVPSAIGKGAGIETVQRDILNIPAKDDTQHLLKAEALQAAGNIATARWLLFEEASSSLKWPFLAILVFWLAAIFMSFGLFAPRNASVLAALFLSALSVAGSIYLILELDQPYGGLIKISSVPLQMALEQLGRQ